MSTQVDREDGVGHECDVGGRRTGARTRRSTCRISLTLVNNMLKGGVQEDYELVLVERVP